MNPLSMIEINLFDHKRIAMEVKVQEWITASIGLVGAGLVLIGIVYLNYQTQVIDAKTDADRFEQLVADNEGQYKKVLAMKAEMKSVEGVIATIDGLRSQEYEVSQLMEDLSDSIPEGLWLKSLAQKTLNELESKKVPVLFLLTDDAEKKKKGKKKKDADAPQHLFIEILGSAVTDQAIVRYIEQLEELDYLDNVFVHKTRHIQIGLEKARAFTIYCHVTNPALAT